jgi:hypothetical protein
MKYLLALPYHDDDLAGRKRCADFAMPCAAISGRIFPRTWLAEVNAGIGAKDIGQIFDRHGRGFWTFQVLDIFARTPKPCRSDFVTEVGETICVYSHLLDARRCGSCALCPNTALRGSQPRRRSNLSLSKIDCFIQDRPSSRLRHFLIASHLGTPISGKAVFAGYALRVREYNTRSHGSRLHNYPPRWNAAPSQELLVAITTPARCRSIRCAEGWSRIGARTAAASRSTPNARRFGLCRPSGMPTGSADAKSRSTVSSSGRPTTSPVAMPDLAPA